MKRQIARTKELLAAGQMLDGLMQARLARVPASKVAPYSENLRNQLLALLGTIEEALNRRATRVADLPNWLATRLDSLIALIELNDESKLEEVNTAFRAITDHKELVVIGLVRSSAEAISGRLNEGYDAVREAVESSAKARGSAAKSLTSERQAEDAAVKSGSARVEAEEHARQAEGSAAAADTAAKKATKNFETTEALRDDTKELRKSAQKHADHAATMSSAVDSIREELEDLLSTENESFQTHQEFRETYESDLSEIEKKARRVLFEATTAALAKEWAAKRRNAQCIAGAWCVLLFLFVGVALASSLFIVVPEAFRHWLPEGYLTRLAAGDNSFQHSLMTKVFIVPPLIFAIWFAASQYAHTRDRQLEFGKRETLAKTLEAYQMYLKDLAPDDDDWQKEVLKLFKGSIEKLYEYLLSSAEPNQRTTFRLLKQREYTLEDAVEQINKLKSLGVNFSDPPNT